jgi:hypothetical protein
MMPKEETPEYWRDRDRSMVEATASGATVDTRQAGLARAELIRRDREYAEAQEQTRRDFETGLFNAESERQAKRQEFEEALVRRQMEHAAALAQRQMDHAAELADKQLAAAADVAKATKWAVWATALAAFGALVQGAVAVIGLLKH